MTFLEKIKTNFKANKNIAFAIDEITYTYIEFSEKIVAIQQLLLKHNVKDNDIVIVHANNDIETYASIFAIWFLGATFVPINPNHPKERNELILNQVKSKLILTSNDKEKNIVCTKNISESKDEIIIRNDIPDRLMYILFTSGSTGIPKGVAITLKNISSFIVDFNAEYNLSATDKFLQIYDLTFDASVHCYLLPIYLGASIYTVNPKKIKYLEAYKIMEKQEITFAKMPPSVIAYLKPYFNRIKLPELKYSLFGGEGLNYELVKLWQDCVPNAQVQNVYGPTEATINTHIFNISKQLETSKTYNGTVSIGKPFGFNKAFIVDTNNNILPKNTKGELCLYGNQITVGYWKNATKNKTSFFEYNNHKVYKTGDLAFIDNDGDCIFCGRIDNQVQIQGYRVELSEIENAARQFKNALNYVVLSKKNRFGVTEVILFVEKLEKEIKALQNFLKQRLPSYMLPSKIVNLEKFPIATSGKIDKQTLLKNLE